MLDRLANNVAKRKSTMPQKFVGKGRNLLPLCDKKISPHLVKTVVLCSHGCCIVMLDYVYINCTVVESM